MSNLTRLILSVIAGFFFGGTGLFVGSVFLRLVFPVSPQDPLSGLNHRITALFACIVFSALGGFFLCWKLLGRFVEPFFTRPRRGPFGPTSL